MDSERPIRWGILGTAGIAQGMFLPGLRAAGGVPYAVGSRDRDRAERFAGQNEIQNAHAEYADVLEDDQVEAVYIPLPNALHAEWTIAALLAGKAVLCEKPLCLSLEETARVLEVAYRSEPPLWEAFVFPFRNQTRRVLELIAGGAIGEVREIQSNFHYPLESHDDIRMVPALGGGSLYDLGCYPIRLANLIFNGNPTSATANAHWAPEGVDDEVQGVVNFGEERRLVFSCGMIRGIDPFSRILGTGGEIRLSHSFHPSAIDTIEIHNAAGVVTENASGTEPSFTPMLQHIDAVLRGEEKPRHLAVDDAMDNAVAIDLIRQSARHSEWEHVAAP